jgi:hypothetical protein
MDVGPVSNSLSMFLEHREWMPLSIRGIGFQIIILKIPINFHVLWVSFRKRQFVLHDINDCKKCVLQLQNQTRGVVSNHSEVLSKFLARSVREWPWSRYRCRRTQVPPIDRCLAALDPAQSLPIKRSVRPRLQTHTCPGAYTYA